MTAERRLRRAETGDGRPLVHLQPAPDLGRAHELLARHRRVIALECGPQAAEAIDGLGFGEFDLLATAETCEAALAIALGVSERVGALVLESPGAPPPGLRPRLRELTVQTLVMLGTADGAAAQQAGRAYADLMPNAHLVYVYDAGAAIGRDRPEAFAEVVGDFLERHEAFIISRTPTVIHP
jgi:pimeloyl-ACP methyl ester carboxylesterase